MTVTSLGVLLQGAALWLVHVVNRARRLRHPAALLLVLAVAEHGLAGQRS